MRLSALNPRVALLLIASAAVLLRLPPAALIHLTEDEAYYRLWAQHLQLGYYDHPPMIAWWIAAGSAWLGDNPLGVRLLPTLATGVTTWLAGDLAMRLGLSPRTAIRSAILYNATLTVALGGLLAVPDAPNSFFWIATLWTLALIREGRSSGWWVAAGFAAGLACLSKYSALFLAPGVVLWLAADPARRKELARPYAWIAAAVALAVFAANVAWNASHGWVTFAKQFGRAGATGLHLNYLPEFLLTQFFLLNPAVSLLAGRQVVKDIADPHRGASPTWLLTATTLPFFGYLLLHSLHARVQGHWPVPVFAPLAICAAAAYESTAGKRFVAWGVRIAAAFAFAVSAVVLIHLARPKIGSIGVGDPAQPVVGWRDFARAVEQQRRADGAGWVGVLNYGLYGQLDIEGQIAAPLLQINERARYPWRGASPDLTAPGLLIDLDRRLDSTDLKHCFGDVRRGPVLERGFKSGPVLRYATYLVARPKVDLWNDGCVFKGDILPSFGRLGGAKP